MGGNMPTFPAATAAVSMDAKVRDHASSALPAGIWRDVGTRVGRWRRHDFLHDRRHRRLRRRRSRNAITEGDAQNKHDSTYGYGAVQDGGSRRANMLVIFPFAFARILRAVKFPLFTNLPVRIVMVAHGVRSLKNTNAMPTRDRYAPNRINRRTLTNIPTACKFNSSLILIIPCFLNMCVVQAWS